MTFYREIKKPAITLNNCPTPIPGRRIRTDILIGSTKKRRHDEKKAIALDSKMVDNRKVCLHSSL